VRCQGPHALLGFRLLQIPILPTYCNPYVAVSGARASHHRTEALRRCAEWGRIEPQKGCFDPAAIAHYHKIFDCLIRCAAAGLIQTSGSPHVDLAALPAALPKVML